MNISKFLALSMFCGLCASCTDIAEDNQASNVQGGVISFSAEGVSTDSRAAERTIDDLREYGFKVYAKVAYTSSTKTNALMKGSVCTYNGGPWKYSPVAYWPTENDAVVNFYAVYDPEDPLDSEKKDKNINTIYGWDLLPHTTYTVNSNVMEQTDFLWAAPTLNATRTSEAARYGVKFNFQHALSGITLDIKESDYDYTPFTDFKSAVAGLLLGHSIIMDPAATVSQMIESVEITGNFPQKAEIDPSATQVKNAWNYSQSSWSPRTFKLKVTDDASKVDESPIYYDGSEYKTTDKGKLMVFPCGDLNVTVKVKIKVLVDSETFYLIASKDYTEKFEADTVKELKIKLNIGKMEVSIP